MRTEIMLPRRPPPLTPPPPVRQHHPTSDPIKVNTMGAPSLSSTLNSNGHDSQAKIKSSLRKFHGPERPVAPKALNTVMERVIHTECEEDGALKPNI